MDFWLCTISYFLSLMPIEACLSAVHKQLHSSEYVSLYVNSHRI